MNKTTFIYGLIDPDTGEIRYVGNSKNPAKRLIAHIQEGRRAITLVMVRQSKHYIPSPKCFWIGRLLYEGKRPTVTILEECPVSEGMELERQWIKRLVASGAQLTNCVNNQEAHKAWYACWDNWRRPRLSHKGKSYARFYTIVKKQTNDNY